MLTCETADRRADGSRLRGQRRYWGSPSQENPILSSDHFHWGKQLLTKSPLGLLVSAEVGQAVRMMFHILKLFGSMSQSWGFCVGRELLLSILKLIFTWTSLLQPYQTIDDVMCTWTLNNNRTQCQPCKRLAGPIIPHSWSGIVWISVSPMDTITLGHSTTFFLCIRPFSAWHPNERITNQTTTGWS